MPSCAKLLFILILVPHAALQCLLDFVDCKVTQRCQVGARVTLHPPCALVGKDMSPGARLLPNHSPFDRFLNLQRYSSSATDNEARLP